MEIMWKDTTPENWREKTEMMAGFIVQNDPSATALADEYRVMMVKDNQYDQKVVAYQTEGKEEIKVRKKAWDAKQKRRKQREKQAEKEEYLEEKQQKKEAKMKKKKEKKGAA